MSTPPSTPTGPAGVLFSRSESTSEVGGPPPGWRRAPGLTGDGPVIPASSRATLAATVVLSTKQVQNRFQVLRARAR